jgi:hypothetical protein
VRHAILTGILLAAMAVPVSQAAAQTKGSLGTVTLAKKVMADGKPLAAGTYQVRLAGENAKPGVGQSADGEQYVEFVKGGKVVAREVATVVSNADIGSIVKTHKPVMNAVRVETLKGNDYVRVWINKSGQNYLINLPTGA